MERCEYMVGRRFACSDMQRSHVVVAEPHAAEPQVTCGGLHPIWIPYRAYVVGGAG